MRLLDLFCCQGGAAVGYARAGWTVLGVDSKPQRRYPYDFVQADALEYLTDHAHEFDAVHASPPCQPYSITRHTHSNDYPDLVDATRDALEASGLPWIMENVVGAPLRNPLTLCGTEFGLTTLDTDGRPLFLRRHRLFESSHLLMSAGGCQCSLYRARGYKCAGAYGGGSVDRTHAETVRRGGYTPAAHVRGQLMGIDWMTLYGLSQAIPPAYTEHLGHQLADHLEAVR